MELTPVQRWFFELARRSRSTSIRRCCCRPASRCRSRRCGARCATWLCITTPLRLRFAQEGGVTRQNNAGSDDTVTVQALDLSTLPPAQQTARIATAAAEAQASMNLEHGPLMRLLWIDLGAAAHGRLLWVIHHPAVDGVSFRILLEDLETAYGQACAGWPCDCRRRRLPYQQWAQHLRQHAQSESVSRELPYWLSLPSTRSLPSDISSGTIRCSRRILAVDLDEGETTGSCTDSQVCMTPMSRMRCSLTVLSALVPWVGTRRLRIDLEHHGRHELAPGLDLSRTVGWFTALYPRCWSSPMCRLRTRCAQCTARECISRALAWDMVCCAICAMM